jgi:spermidine synthase
VGDLVNPIVGVAAIIALFGILFIARRSRSGKASWLYLLFFLSGFPALIYQIVWQRSLFAIYGVNIESVTVVITAFMLGLGLGSLFGGWLSKQSVPRLLVFACVELGIAGFGILSLPLFHWIATYTAGTTTLKAGVITFLLVLLPTILMGSTLPLLVAHIVDRSGNVGRSVGTLYFVNTLGSATACFVAGMILMRSFGQSGSVQIAAGLNACIGLSVLLLFVRSRRTAEASADAKPDTAKPQVSISSHDHLPLKIGVLLAALSGFVALGYEILWYRVLSFTSGGVARALALLLGTYLAGIAFGSFFSERLCHFRRHAGIRHFIGLTAALIVAANVLGYLVIPYLAYRVPRYDLDHPFLLILVTTACFGASFPLISHISIQPGPDSGAKLSYLYLGNIIGSAAGSFVIGFIFMDVWPLSRIAVTLAVMGIGVGAALIFLSRDAGLLRFTGALAGCVLAATTIVLSSSPLFNNLYERLQYKHKWQQAGQFAHIVETKSGIVTVSPDGAVFGGGIYDGMYNVDLVHDTNHTIRAYALSAFHPAPKQVLMVGLSSGSWAQIVANHPQLEKLTIVEINPGYLRLIPQYPQVASLLRNLKVEIVIDDGRRWLLRNRDKKFDVIVMNTTFHWRDHASNLLSTEFLELIREHLNPGGVHYYNTTGSFEVMLTGATVFPYSLRVINFMAVSDSPIDVNKERWRRILLEYKIDGKPVIDLARKGDRGRLDEVLSLANSTAPVPLNHVVAMETGATFRERFRGKRIITDDNMGTEWLQ